MEQPKTNTFIVQIPLEVEADTPHEALAKVPVPEGCKVVSLSVQPKPPQLGVRPPMPAPQR